MIISATERGKCGRAILGNFSKVTSAGSDKDVIRTCFLGHILQCGGSITIPVLLSQVLCIFIIYTRSGEVGKACQSLGCRNEGGISAKCCHCICLAVTVEELHQLTNAWGALSGCRMGFTALAQPTPVFQVLQAGDVLPWQRHSRPPSIPGGGVWATLSRSTPPCPCTLCRMMLEWSGRA